MTRHEFLKALHELLQPERYLEVGVQLGTSLRLSDARISIGIDPEPLIVAEALRSRIDQYFEIRKMTSDDYFADEDLIMLDLAGHKIDLAFIDGMHLVENALRDFANIERYCHERSVIVFDDVLPTTREMAARAQCPGDWTGDVWRVYDILRERRPDLVLLLVDTQPTGVLVVLKPDPLSILNQIYACDGWPINAEIDIPVHDAVLDRRHALPASVVLAEIARRLT